MKNIQIDKYWYLPTFYLKESHKKVSEKDLLQIGDILSSITRQSQDFTIKYLVVYLVNLGILVSSTNSRYCKKLVNESIVKATEQIHQETIALMSKN